MGKVTQILGPDTYQVERPNGGTYRRNRVHMRVTKITSKILDKSPTVTSRAHDVTPATPPSQAPQTHSSPTDPSLKEIELRSAQDKIAPTGSRGQLLSANRPRREIKVPIRFKD